MLLKLNTEINSELMEILGIKTRKFSAYKLHELDNVFVKLNMMQYDDFTNTQDAMNNFVDIILHNVSFEWSVFPIPNTDNLGNCNVIETIVEAADVSVKKNNLICVIRRI